jgi:hypothetical protein
MWNDQEYLGRFKFDSFFYTCLFAWNLVFPLDIADAVLNLYCENVIVVRTTACG